MPVAVYPTMRITDSWGVLEASNGALVKSDWSAVVVTEPGRRVHTSTRCWLPLPH